MKKPIVVLPKKANLMAGIIGTLFFIVVLIYIIVKPNDTVTPFVYITVVVFILLCIYVVAISLRWKLTITDHTLTYQPVLGHKKSISFKSIEKVKVKKSSTRVASIRLVVKGKPSIWVDATYDGFRALVKWLQKENIPFYHNGEIINFKP